MGHDAARSTAKPRCGIHHRSCHLLVPDADIAYIVALRERAYIGCASRADHAREVTNPGGDQLV